MTKMNNIISNVQSVHDWCWSSGYDLRIAIYNFFKRKYYTSFFSIEPN